MRVCAPFYELRIFVVWICSNSAFRSQMMTILAVNAQDLSLLQRVDAFSNPSTILTRTIHFDLFSIFRLLILRILRERGDVEEKWRLFIA